MTSVEIIPLNHRDRSISHEIRAILYQAYSVEADLIGVDSFPPLARTSSEVAASLNRFFGAMENGELRAVIELESRENPDIWLGISSLCVVPRSARTGLGSALLKFALSLGARTVEVSTASENRPAIALYEKMGFRIVGSEINQHGISVVQLVRGIAA